MPKFFTQFNNLNIRMGWLRYDVLSFNLFYFYNFYIYTTRNIVGVPDNWRF